MWGYESAGPFPPQGSLYGYHQADTQKAEYAI